MRRATSWVCVLLVMGVVGVVSSAAATTVTLREGLGGYGSTHDATLVSNQGGSPHDFLTDGGRSVQESWGGTLTPFSTTRSGTSWSTGMLRFGDIFTFGSIPDGSTINSATLTLTITNPIEGTHLGVMTTGWDESTVTWDAFGSGSPASGGGVTPGAEAASSPTSLGTLSGTQNINVTANVQSWLDNPGTNFGWAFLRDDQNKGLFVASEDVVNVLDRPTLTINFTAPPVPEPSTGAILALVGLAMVTLRSRRAKSGK